MEDDSPLKENEDLLAQNEYEEDSSDEEVGPIATFGFFIRGYEIGVMDFLLCELEGRGYGQATLSSKGNCPACSSLRTRGRPEAPRRGCEGCSR